MYCVFFTQHALCIAVGIVDNKTNVDVNLDLADTAINCNEIKLQQLLDTVIKSMIDYLGSKGDIT